MTDPSTELQPVAPMLISVKGLPNMLIVETDAVILHVNTTLTEGIGIDKKQGMLYISYPHVKGQELLDKAYRYNDLLQLIEALEATAAQHIVVNGDGNMINSSVDNSQ